MFVVNALRGGYPIFTVLPLASRLYVGRYQWSYFDMCVSPTEMEYAKHNTECRLRFYCCSSSIPHRKHAHLEDKLLLRDRLLLLRSCLC